MRMLRNVIGAILALAGAAAAVWSPFRVWYDGRQGRDYRVAELFTGTGVTEAGAQLFGSLFLPFAVAALLALAGVVLRSRPTIAVAGVLVIAFTVLWMVRVGQAEGSLTVDGSGNGLGVGAGNALVGGVVLILAALLMAGRRRRPEPEPRYRRPYPEPEYQQPYPEPEYRRPYPDHRPYPEAAHPYDKGRPAQPYDEDRPEQPYDDGESPTPYSGTPTVDGTTPPPPPAAPGTESTRAWERPPTDRG